MANRVTVALVGSESLLGREIRDLVATSAPELDLRLIAADSETPGKLTRVGDEPILVEELKPESIDGADAVLLAGSAASARQALALAAEAEAAVIDATSEAEEEPAARLRAPLVEPAALAADASIHVIAHPAAIALALLLRHLHARDPITRAVVQIFAPASEQGLAGVEELQHQAISLLSFKSLPKAIFDEQLAFNMLARYGGEAARALEETELRIERHLATLLALESDGPPMPSLRLVQAPVFHGYTFSVWVEFEQNPGVEALESSLDADGIDLRGGEFDPPNNVGQAGQSGIAVGAITPDRNNPEACWFWLVADNLRLAAENAVAVARQLA